MLNLLQILLAEFHDKLTRISEGVPREAQLAKVPDKIKVVIGMRRTGKTFFLLQYINDFIHIQKIPLSRILYLNFEDDRIRPCSQTMLRELLDNFYTLYPENHDHECYLFFDEIQNVYDWALLIRRFFDTRKVQIFLTGSSAKLLSKEIHTSLRGRSISTEIWPYSFNEFLIANNTKMDKGLISQKKSDVLQHQLELYLTQGGLPETITKPKDTCRQLLQDHVELVIMHDVVERYNISHIALIKYLIKTLLKNAACTFSVNKFTNDIKSQGFSSSKNTVYDYFNYLEDSYLIFPVSLYSESLRKTYSNPRKIYAADTGLINAYSFSTSTNIGHLFENLILLDLKRRGDQIFYYRTKEGNFEVDFFTIDRFGRQNLYQVCWDISDEVTFKRERRALEIAEKELNITGTMIVPSLYITNILKKGNAVL